MSTGRVVWTKLLRNLVVLALVTGSAMAEDPAPVTTADPAIPVDQLDLMLTPLTQDELVVEADGWLQVLKQRVQAVTEAKLAVSRAAAEKAAAQAQAAKAKAKAKAEAETEEARPKTPDASSARAADEAEARAAEQKAEAKDDEKDKAQQRIAKLNEQQVLAADRLRVVLDALRDKGGDPGPYEEYIGAISKLKVNWYDPEALWATFRGWAVSEQGGIRLARNLALFAVVLVVVRFISGFVGSLVHRALSFTKQHSDLLRSFLVTLARTAVWVFGLVFALQMLEVDITPMIAALGAAGLVIAFALQGTVSNFAAGVMILLYRPFDVGDVVTAGGVTGSVVSMNLVQTTIKTPDNQMLIVPNADIWGGVITNVTGSDTRRVDMVFGIGYGDDIEKARQALLSVLSRDSRVLKDPEPMIVVSELADSSVNIATRPWVRTSDYWGVYFDTHEAVKKEFDALGISIPFPQQDVHMHQAGS